MDGNGVMLIDGEVFNWRPWEAKGSMTLANKKGQLELPAEAFAVFDLLWPRPGTLVLNILALHSLFNGQMPQFITTEY